MTAAIVSGTFGNENSFCRLFGTDGKDERDGAGGDGGARDGATDGAIDGVRDVARDGA